MSNRISRNQAMYLAHIHRAPGCSKADVNRACKRNPRAGHCWIYASVGRLVRRGFVAYTETRPESARGGATGLVLTNKGRAAIGLDPAPQSEAA